MYARSAPRERHRSPVQYALTHDRDQQAEPKAERRQDSHLCKAVPNESPSAGP